MGDNGVIKVYQESRFHDGSGPVYLYTHWNGDKIYGYLKRALARQERWNEPAYLTRIIFCEMIKEDVDGSTGYGISSFFIASDHTILGVNPRTEMITFETEDGRIKSEVSFDAFVKRQDKWSR